MSRATQDRAPGRTQPLCAPRRKSGIVLALVLTPAALCLGSAPASAHDAFGDLGPFYASLLHPLADPLQAVLLAGSAAFLAGRPLTDTRVAFPVFIGMAALAASLLAAGAAIAFPTVLTAWAALLAGLAALLPATWPPRWVTCVLVAVTGALTGLAPGTPATGAILQPWLGTVLGISALAILAWFALETGSRRLTPLVPRVAGSWVAAIGILVAAFST